MIADVPELIGILGGTFDPIHLGHLRIAEEIAEIAGLQQMRFIPARLPRLRNAPGATAEHRAEMVRLGIVGNHTFMLDEREVKRTGVSYSVESLRELERESGGKAILCFVVGADAFLKLVEWYNWRELFQLCHFIIAARPGHSPDIRSALPLELEKECARRWVMHADSLKLAPAGSVFVAQTTLLDISATNIRKRVAAGKSIRYLVPDAINDHIAINCLYREKG